MNDHDAKKACKYKSKNFQLPEIQPIIAPFFSFSYFVHPESFLEIFRNPEKKRFEFSTTIFPHDCFANSNPIKEFTLICVYNVSVGGKGGRLLYKTFVEESWRNLETSEKVEFVFNTEIKINEMESIFEFVILNFFFFGKTFYFLGEETRNYKKY